MDRKILFLLALAIPLLTIGAGCNSLSTTTPVTQQVIVPTTSKVISWCDDKKTVDNELWISSEYFNGMNHAPTIRHVCRGNKEIIYLEMVWNDSTTEHMGMLKSKNSETALSVSSKNKDPEFELLQNQDKNKVRFTVDNKIFMYDEGSDKFIENPLVQQPDQPNTCKDVSEGTPAITLLSANSGSIGTKIEINGCNFSGFEGEKNAWIENSQGVKGIIYGEDGSTSKLLRITLKSPLCQKDNSYSGQACDASLALVPGSYKIYAMSWGKESNKIEFTIH